MKKKKIILFSVSALFICLIAVLSCVFMNSNNKDLSNINDNLIVETKNSEHIKLVRKNSVNDSGTESVFIAAELNGSNTDNIDLAFSLDWTKSTNLELSDCLQLDVSEDQRSCNITFLNAFDVQAVLNVSAVNDDSIIAATCSIDCYTRVTHITDFALEFNEETFIHSQFDNGEYIYDFSEKDSAFILNSRLTAFPVDYTGIGSIARDPSFVKEIHISNELLQLFAQNNISVAMTNSFIEDFGGFSLVKIMICLLTGMPDGSLTNAQIDILEQCTHWFYVTIEVDGVSMQIELVDIPVENLFTKTSISLSKDSVIF